MELYIRDMLQENKQIDAMADPYGGSCVTQRQNDEGSTVLVGKPFTWR